MRLGNVQPEPEPRRGRNAALVVVCLYLAAVVTANVWTAGFDFPQLSSAPPVEELANLPNPKVLRHSVIALPNAIVAVPYQAGAYELHGILPAELSLHYRHTGEPIEGRVVFFTEAGRNRWSLMAEGAARRFVDEDMSPSDLIDMIRWVERPRAWDRLWPWRLVKIVGRSEARRLVIAEGGGAELRRLWRWETGEATAVGREYPLGGHTGSRVVVTVFKNARIYDLQFAFNFPSKDNQALVRAWIEAIAPAGAKRPNNEVGLVECTATPGVDPTTAGARLCRELYLLAGWLTNRYDTRIASRLVDFLEEHDDREGLRAVTRQVKLRQAEDAAARRLLERIEHLLAQPVVVAGSDEEPAEPENGDEPKGSEDDE